MAGAHFGGLELPLRLRHGSHKVSAPAKNTRPKPTIHRMLASAA
jgi:hypothetical protein